MRAEWEGDAEDNAKQVAKDFHEYLESHHDQIEALTIFYSQPHRRAELTYNMIRQLFEKLRSDKPRLAPLRVWRAYALLDEYQGSQRHSTRKADLENA